MSRSTDSFQVLGRGRGLLNSEHAAAYQRDEQTEMMAAAAAFRTHAPYTGVLFDVRVVSAKRLMRSAAEAANFRTVALLVENRTGRLAAIATGTDRRARARVQDISEELAAACELSDRRERFEELMRDNTVRPSLLAAGVITAQRAVRDIALKPKERELLAELTADPVGLHFTAYYRDRTRTGTYDPRTLLFLRDLGLVQTVTDGAPATLKVWLTEQGAAVRDRPGARSSARSRTS